MRLLKVTVFGLILAAIGPGTAMAAGASELMRSLPPRESVTEADAVKTAAVLLGERQQAMNLAACEKRLRDADVLTVDDAYEPNRPLRKGFASMVIARGLGLKGGWAGRIAGRLGPRLAYKELEFLGMVPPMGVQDLMTGAELLGLLIHAQEHMRAEVVNKKTIQDFKTNEKARRYGR